MVWVCTMVDTDYHSNPSGKNITCHCSSNIYFFIGKFCLLILLIASVLVHHIKNCVYLAISFFPAQSGQQTINCFHFDKVHQHTGSQNTQDTAGEYARLQRVKETDLRLGVEEIKQQLECTSVDVVKLLNMNRCCVSRGKV